MFPRILSPKLVSAAALAVTASLFARSPSQDAWREALGPPQGEVPAPPSGEVVWRDDFDAALAEAQATKRALLVTWRCLPCKQCAEFDQDVLEGGPELTPLLKQFVTVRLTDAAKLDERYFPYRGYQDLDLSWWGYFLSPEGALYAVFGGKDHLSDSTRISTAAFANTMRRVLAHHHDPRRPAWHIDGPAPDPAAAPRTPREIASFRDFRAERPWVQQQECIHCHQVNDILHFDAMQQGTFNLKQYTQAWPLPENVGLHLDRDDGLLVMKVQPGSPAAAAGLEPGDRLAMAGQRKLFGQADFRGVLHRADYDSCSIPISWMRDGELRFGALETGDNWRAGEHAWRKSVYDGIYGPHLGFFPLHGPSQGKGRMSFRPFMGPGDQQQNNSWHPIGLRPNMEIVEVNGRRDDWDSRQLLAWFRLNHKPGDTVTLKTSDQRTFEKTIEKSE